MHVHGLSSRFRLGAGIAARTAAAALGLSMLALAACGGGEQDPERPSSARASAAEIYVERVRPVVMRVGRLLPETRIASVMRVRRGVAILRAKRRLERIAPPRRLASAHRRLTRTVGGAGVELVASAGRPHAQRRFPGFPRGWRAALLIGAGGERSWLVAVERELTRVGAAVPDWIRRRRAAVAVRLRIASGRGW